MRPAKAEPLLFAWDVNAYVISLSPCGPGFATEPSAVFNTTDTDANARITSGTNKM